MKQNFRLQVSDQSPGGGPTVTQHENAEFRLCLCTIKCVEVMEAAIGIEPMNKGFAVRLGALSLSVMECHRPVFIDLF